MTRRLLLVSILMFGCTSPEGSADDLTGGNGLEIDAGSGGDDGITGLGGDVGSGGDVGGTKPDGGPCKPNLTGVVRDFKDDHPDFEKFTSDVGEKGILDPTLGTDDKPIHVAVGATAQTTSRANFDQWFHNVDGVNMNVLFELKATSTTGLFVYDNPAFFPVDDKGFGNQGRAHNFHFTFELHTEFAYKGGEVFTFTGDDDMWVYINRKLAIDLGGVHPSLSMTIKLDEMTSQLGIEKGKTYPMAIFQAERHTDESHFRIETSLEFTNCAPIIK